MQIILTITNGKAVQINIYIAQGSAETNFRCFVLQLICECDSEKLTTSVCICKVITKIKKRFVFVRYNEINEFNVKLMPGVSASAKFRK